MRWVCLPQAFRSPDVFDLNDGLWYSPDTGRLALLFSDAVVIVEGGGLFPGLKVGNAELALAPTLYAGHNWWAGGGWCVFRSLVSSRWTAMQGSGPAEPVAYYDEDSGSVVGDAWHDSQSLPMSPSAATSPSATFAAQGTATGSLTVSMFWPRWRKSGTPTTGDWTSPLGGQYEPIDGATGTLLLGAPAWRRDTDGAIFQHRTGGGIWQYDRRIMSRWWDHIVEASDESGDYCFYNNRDLRLREFPTDGQDADLFTLDADSGDYSPAGHLVSLGDRVVPYFSPAATGSPMFSHVIGRPMRWSAWPKSTISRIS